MSDQNTISRLNELSNDDFTRLIGLFTHADADGSKCLEDIAVDCEVDWINLPNKDKCPETIFRILRNRCYPISVLYKFLAEYKMMSVANFLKDHLTPNEIIEIENGQKTKVGGDIESLLFKETDTARDEYNILDLKNAQHIVPVIHSNDANDSSLISSNLHNNYYLDHNFSTNSKTLAASSSLRDKFKFIKDPKRNLSFVKRSFTKLSHYNEEIKMIKHLHLNLYTPNAIFKNLTNDNYYLLYHNIESGFTLDEIVEYNKSLNLNDQLTLLHSIANALVYLHDLKSGSDDIGSNSMLHGNLKANNIIIMNINGRIIPKIYDFTQAKHRDQYKIDEYKNYLKEEIFQFGVIFYIVISCKMIDEKRCMGLRKEIPDDSNKRARYYYEFSKKYGISRDREFGCKLCQLFFQLIQFDLKPFAGGLNKCYNELNTMMGKCLKLEAVNENEK